MPIVMESDHEGVEATVAPSSWRIGNHYHYDKIYGTEGSAATDTRDPNRLVTLLSGDGRPECLVGSAVETGARTKRSNVHVTSSYTASETTDDGVSRQEAELHTAVTPGGREDESGEGRSNLRNTLSNLPDIIRQLPIAPPPLRHYLSQPRDKPEPGPKLTRRAFPPPAKVMVTETSAKVKANPERHLWTALFPLLYPATQGPSTREKCQETKVEDEEEEREEGDLEEDESSALSLVGTLDISAPTWDTEETSGLSQEGSPRVPIRNEQSPLGKTPEICNGHSNVGHTDATKKQTALTAAESCVDAASLTSRLSGCKLPGSRPSVCRRVAKMVSECEREENGCVDHQVLYLPKAPFATTSTSSDIDGLWSVQSRDDRSHVDSPKAVDSPAVSVPTAVSFLKTMQKAFREVTEIKRSEKRSHSPKPAYVYEDISDEDELPDLDEPMGNSQICLCTCQSTRGRTMLMCKHCRLAPNPSEPLLKKPKKDRHFLDVISLTTDISEDSQSIESFEAHGHDACLDLENHQILETKREKAYESDSSLESIKPYSIKRKDSVSSLESIEPYSVNSSPTEAHSGIQSDTEELPTRRTVQATTKNIETLPIDSRSVTRKLSERPPHFTVPLHSDMIFDQKSAGTSNSVTKIAELQLSMIEGMQEEALTCDGLLLRMTQLVKEFTTSQCEPPDTLVRYLFKILSDSLDTKLSFQIYNLIQTITKLHPPMGTIPLEWSDLELVIDKLRLPYGLKNLPPCEAVSNVLALQIICSLIETELLHRSLASQMRVMRSVAYRWLSAEICFGHVKEVIQWLNQALLYGEYEDVLSKLTLNTNNPSPDQYVPNVLPSLQKLLDFSVIVSKRPEECANRISIELVHMFRCVPSQQARRLFLSTVTSPLLKFTLAQRLLEDHCGAETCGAQCLQDILEADFKAGPMRTSLTPPPTPSSDDEEEMDMERQRRQPTFHDEGWEELVLLLWTVVSSYLATAKAGLKYPLWKRVLIEPTGELELRDKKSLKDFPSYIKDLKRRIEANVPQISSEIFMYLTKMECLCDIQ